MRRIFARIVGSLGDFEILEAADGREALRQAGGKRVELLVTDWNMPVMGGLDLVRKLRDAPGGDAMRVLMVTGRDAETDVREALKAGVDSYILKPFTLDAIRSKLEKLAGSP
jgi:two-component system chemotaxis response regulator CheY